MGLLQCGISTQTTPLWVKSSDPDPPQGPSLCLHHSRKLP
jgi:hypothetical protein